MVEIQKAVYDDICQTLGEKEAECGGILGARMGEPISKFYFDHSGISTPDAYTPDYETINEILEEWAEDGMQMVGIIHSHGNEGNFPSCCDLYYCEQILRNNPSLKEFLLPIVTLAPFSIHVYRVSFFQKLRISKDNLLII
ncbi:MAG: Mov34/MPN/PAD-1 family protein [Clostridia bacterium]|nr:Mov34/MPN/PAD-1 family protein [Clostridia bacterium]